MAGLEDNRALRAVQAFLDRHVPGETAQKWVWFALLWVFGIVSLTVFAYALRFVMGLS